LAELKTETHAVPGEEEVIYSQPRPGIKKGSMPSPFVAKRGIEPLTFGL
jgi:hypothetical protein